MFRRSWLALLVLASGMSELSAQFLPVVVPEGIGFRYRSGRLRVGGFFHTGYSVGYLPAGGFAPGPGIIVPVVPGYAVPTSSYVDTRIGVTVIAPVVTLPPRPRFFHPDEVDLSGVDLDVSPSPLLADRKDPPRGELRKPDRPDPGEKLPVKDKEKPAIVPKIELPKIDKPKVDKPKEPPPAERSHLLLGLESFRDGDFGLAAFHFRQATETDPATARPYFLLAQAYFAQGKFRDAVETIHSGLKKDPDFPTSPFRPVIELYKGMELEYARQRKLLDDLVVEHPKNGRYLFLQGYLNWFEDRRDEARKSFTLARPFMPDPWFVDRFLKAGDGPVAAK